MIIHVRTKSGSLYEVDNENKKWARLEKSEGSGPLRTDEGELSSDAHIKLGEPMILLGPPLVPQTWGRIIMTTDVVEITERRD